MVVSRHLNCLIRAILPVFIVYYLLLAVAVLEANVAHIAIAGVVAATGDRPDVV